VSTHKSRGKFEVRWREGKRNRSRTFARSTDAKSFERHIQGMSQRGFAIPPRTGGTDLETFCAEWMVDRRGLARNTRNLYERLLATHVLDQIGHVPVSQLTTARLDEWQRERLGKGAGRESIAKTQKILHQILNRAVKRQLLLANPVDLMDPVERQRQKVEPADAFGVEAMRTYFLSKKRLGDATLVSVMGYGGLRVGEALALTWSSVDGARLSVDFSLEEDGTLRETKADSDRVIDLPSQVAFDLRAWRISLGNPDGFVFARPLDGKPWTHTDRNNWRRRHFKEASKAAGLVKFPPKNLRHTCASLMIAAGRPSTEVAEHMGHSLEVSIKTYQHIVARYKGKDVVAVEQMIAEARGEMFGTRSKAAG